MMLWLFRTNGLILLLQLVLLLRFSHGFTDVIVDVDFYGESQCPYCRQFVMVWYDVWPDLQPYVNFHYVAWGNAYFSTEVCGSGPYSPQQRECWYDHCIVSSNDDDQACFSGNTVYQHSEKEGIIDIYESCVMDLMGLDEAMAFTYCCEGPRMDDDSMSAHDLMAFCLLDDLDTAMIQKCYETNGHAIEVRNAKQTPKHHGVPYVVVDGISLEDPLNITNVICEKLKEAGEYPSVCTQGLDEKFPTRFELS